MTFKDSLKTYSDVLETISPNMPFEVGLSATHILQLLFLSAVSSFIIKWAYVRYAHSMNNKENFSNIFPLLSIVTTVVILIVKHSLALSLGLVGALSIVRFRAAIKEPEELVYLFLIIAIGLSFGANQILPGILITFASFILVFVLSRLNNQKSNIKGTCSLLIVEGENNIINKWLSVNLNRIKKSSEDFSLREITKSSGSTKIVFRFYILNDPDRILNVINTIENKDDIKLDYISEVVIPE